MGRLPAKFAGLDIRYRVPYTMPGELEIAAGATGIVFPDSIFSNTIDKPFEIHRLIPRVTPLDANNDIVIPFTGAADPEVLKRVIQIRIVSTTQNEVITKSNQRLVDLTKGTSEDTWEWAEPYTLTKSSSFQITVSNTSTGAVAAAVPNIRLNLTFQGFLLVVEPPSGSR